MKVQKRDGTTENLNLDKIHKMVENACEGLDDVSVSQVEMSSKLQFFDGITTAYIQDVLVSAANKLIDLDTPNYQYVAARLLLFGLYKSLYPTWQKDGIGKLYNHITRFQSKYDPLLFTKYTEDEWAVLDCHIDHDKDYKFTYASLQQLIDKYLIQDRATGVIYETPQIAYMLIAATVFSDYPLTTRLNKVIDYYHAISDHEINLPTPIMAGVRTTRKSYASCSLLDVADTTNSIGATNNAIGVLTAASSGIGLNIGRMRSIDSSIRDGSVIHPGIIPFLKMFEATAKAFSQANRGGSVTCYTTIWNYEIESVIVLKNNRGTEDTRVRHMDYCIQMSGLFYKRFMNNENITLFSNDDTPGLYESFGSDKFDALYEYYEASDVRKKVIPMQKLFLDLVEERSSTARIYIMNIDHANTHSPYLEQVYQSNLCVAPETPLLTDKGYFPIEDLENQKVNIWNGWEWSDTIVRKTGIDQELIKIKFQDDKGNLHSIDCTKYHKFHIQSGENVIEVRAGNLSIGQYIQNWNPPEFSIDSNISLHQYHRDWCVFNIEHNGRISDTYCLTEQKRNRMVVNGILTGQCVEIIQPSRPLQDINDTGIHKYRVVVPSSDFQKLYDLKYNNKFLEHHQLENVGKIVSNDYILDDNEFVVDDVKIIDKEPPNISSCILGAISWEDFDNDMDRNYKIMNRLCTLEIESLNQIIDLQEYKISSTGIATKCGRYLGIGIAGYATFAAKMGYNYNNPKLWEITHRLAEMQMYCLMSASNQLAKEVGECQWFWKTKYAQGILPIDTYKKSVDDIVPNTLYMDWEGLRKSIKEHGLRNSAFAACMPVQSSSVISNSTNGLELSKSPLTIIKSKNRYLRQIIKDFSQLEDTYTYAYDEDWNIGYINNCAVIQKFFDQSISANTYYSPAHYNNNSVPITILLKHILYAYKMGLKTLYYQNTDDCRDAFEADTPTCAIDNQDCESCKI